MKWIKVQDELPQENQHVIYYFECTGVSSGIYCKGIDGMDCFVGVDGWLCDDVTHWMPLPEAPENNDEM